MIEPKKITKEEAVAIVIEWHKKHKLYELAPATVCCKGQWYDVRGMTNEEVGAFGEKLLGRKLKTVGVNI